MIANFWFDTFYFFPGTTLLNFTTCMDVCSERRMKLPHVDDFDKTRQVMANQTVFKQNANRTESGEAFLTYFIGI